MVHPLEGIKVLDATQAMAGPFATMMLADLGAEVIKVEPPGVGDHVRQLKPESCKGKSPAFIALNRNKKSVTINLKSAAGRELFLKLAEKSDVLVENFKPGIMKKLGVDYHVVKERNKKIIYCSVSGFGQDGPLSQWAAYDLIIQAMGGAMSVTGEKGGRPLRVGTTLGDIIGAMNAAFSIMGALFWREKTGEGCYLDLAMLDIMVSAMSIHIMNYLVSGDIPQPMGTAHPLMAPYESFQTSTHEIVVAAGTEKQWKKFCEVTKLTHLSNDPRFSNVGKRVDNRTELIPIIQEVLSQKPADFWIEVFSANEIPCAPVNDVKLLLDNVQVLHRKMMITIEHTKEGKMQFPGVPWKVPGVVDVHTFPPRLGEHTEEVLAGLVPASELKKYREEGVI